jgi:hypothetical protein
LTSALDEGEWSDSRPSRFKPSERAPGNHWIGRWVWRLKFRIHMILLQNYAGRRQKSYRIMKMQMFATLAKAKLNTENIKGSNFVAVRHTTGQVSKLLLYP